MAAAVRSACIGPATIAMRRPAERRSSRKLRSPGPIELARGTQQIGAMRDVLVASKPLALLSQIRQPGDGQFHNDEIGIVVYFGPQQQGLGAISCRLFVSDIPRAPTCFRPICRIADLQYPVRHSARPPFLLSFEPAPFFEPAAMASRRRAARSAK